MAAALPASPLPSLDRSLNSASSSPQLAHFNSPCTAAASVSPTKRSVKKHKTPRRDSTPLMAKDGNSSSGLLVDVDADEDAFNASPATTPSTSLQPHLALSSLLDRSPSLLKAHLKTPLIPLGTPVTARKTRRTGLRQQQQSLLGVEAVGPQEQENSPCARRSDESDRRSVSSPSPAHVALAVPPTPAAIPLPEVQTVRFSSSVASSASPLFRTAVARSFSTSTAGVGLPSTPLSRPSAAHPLATPWTPFSPYASPAVRTHASYEDEELTDCDADFSEYSIAQEEYSLSEAVPPLDEGEDADEAVEAVSIPMESETADELEQEDAANEQEEDDLEPDSARQLGDEQETSLELSETEVEVLEEKPELQEEPELDSAVEREAEDSDDQSVSPAASAEEEEDDESSSSELEAITETQLSALDVAAEDGSPVDDEQVDAAPNSEEDQLDVPLVEAAKPSEETSAPSVNETEQIAAPSTPNAPRILTPPSPFLSSAPTPVAPSPVTRNEAVQPATPAPAAPAPLVDLATPQPAPVPVIAPFPATPPAVEIAVSTPPAASPTAPEARTPRAATTPARAASTPSFLKPTVAPPTAARTAQRQLTKLTSLAAQRSAAAGSTSVAKPKTTLTSLIPGSAAVGSRRLVAPSARSALPQRSGLAPIPASAVKKAPAMLSAVEEAPVEPSTAGEDKEKRPPSAASSSSGSSSTSAPPPSARPLRPLLKSGLKPPGSAVPSATAPRTLTSSASAAGRAPTRPAVPAAITASRAARPATAAAARAPLVPASTTSTRLVRAGPPSAELSSLRPASSASTTTRDPSPLSQTSSAPSLPSVRPTTSAAPPVRSARTPRAALAAVKAGSAGSLSDPMVSAGAGVGVGASPAKRKPARMVGGKLEVSKSAMLSKDAIPATVEPAPVPRSPSPVAAPPAPPAIFRSSPIASRQLSSPPRAQGARPPVSPLRSPRRVLVGTQQAAPTPASSTALSAPAEKLAVPVEVFPVVATPAPEPKAMPVRASRTRRTRPAEAEPVTAPPVTRTTRRTAATAAPPPAPAAAKPLPLTAPVVRSARRPLRKEASEETTISVASTVSDAADDVPPSSSPRADSPSPAAPSPPPRPAPVFHPAPSVTQAELSRLTQRNTKKNQQPFNKLKVETVFLDYDRPPSPTSKIRRSEDRLGEEGAAGRSSTKEGREARAAKRRNALRASVDGSEVEAVLREMAAEMTSPTAEKVPSPPTEHFRAPGDDEQYVTPVRTGGVLLSGKAAAAAAKGTRQRSSRGASASPASSSPVVKKEERRVRWDKALVYEGPKEEDAAPNEGILKHDDLDDWGNSNTAISSFGKAAPVLIVKRVFKNDEEG
ncbi:hypothetical protein JCM8097_006011 [Rhodosporidiobolus ruineniae]